MTQGYEVLDEGQASVRMRKNTWGTGLHILVAIFTVWWTLGIGNAIYALIAHYTAPEVLVKMDEPGYPGGYGAPPGYQPIPPQGGPRPPQ